MGILGGAEGHHEQALFGWLDYLVFATMLMLSGLIGAYHAWRGNRSTAEYLMGNKRLKTFPVAMSLAASFISGTTLVGSPTDVYFTGSMFFWTAIGLAVAVAISSQFFLPVFRELNIISVNQYLNLRFNRFIQRLASLMFILRQLIYLSIVAYAPCLTLEQVAGINVNLSMGITIGLCTFYTALGGIKAVVWTDALQVTVMFGSVGALIVKGIIDVGGFNTVLLHNVNTSRIEFFNFDFDPTTRYTVWSTVIGNAFYWTGIYGTDQSAVLRFLSMPTLTDAKKSMWLNVLFADGVMIMSCFVGLIAFAKYFDCDPLSSGRVQKPDQVIPLFVLETVGVLPGLTGLFVAGVFSAALSSLSSGMNSVALLILEDFILPYFPQTKDETATKISKLLAALFGLLIFGLTFLITEVKSILDANFSFSGAILGATLGVFTLGMLVPRANSTGAAVSMLCSFVCLITLGLSTQIAKTKGLKHTQMKPLSTENCTMFTNVTATPMSHNSAMPESDDDFFVLLKLSYLWYTPLGVMISLIVGTLASYLSQLFSSTPHEASKNLLFQCKKRQNEMQNAIECTSLD